MNVERCSLSWTKQRKLSVSALCIICVKKLRLSLSVVVNVQKH